MKIIRLSLLICLASVVLLYSSDCGAGMEGSTDTGLGIAGEYINPLTKALVQYYHKNKNWPANLEEFKKFVKKDQIDSLDADRLKSLVVTPKMPAGNPIEIDFTAQGIKYKTFDLRKEIMFVKLTLIFPEGNLDSKTFDLNMDSCKFLKEE